jgi:ABC-type lipoprotein export system ATPase subunit
LTRLLRRAAILAEQAAERQQAVVVERLAAQDHHITGPQHLRSVYPEAGATGQAQRVAMARDVAQEAMLVLADEPTGQLDQAAAREVMAQ